MTTTTKQRKQVGKEERPGKGRFYNLPDGHSYPSVTTILQVIGKPALINWAANEERKLVIEAASQLYDDLPEGPKMSRMGYTTTLQDRLGKVKAHQKLLAKAAEIGSQAHSLIEWNTRKMLGQEVGPEPAISPKAMWAFSVWEQWAKKMLFRPIHCEEIVYSHEHQYAGTMDMLAEITFETGEKVKVLADYKTGKAIYPEALLQNVAYIRALVEMGHVEPPVAGLVVRLPKNELDPEPEIRVIPWDEQDGLFRAFLHARALWGWLNMSNGNGS